MVHRIPALAAVVALLLVGFQAVAEEEYMYTPEEWYELTGENPYADEENPTDNSNSSAIPYVFGLDEEGSAEQLRESGESYFDRPGPVAIDVRESGVFLDVDGDYYIVIPEVSPPTPVDEE